MKKLTKIIIAIALVAMLFGCRQNEEKVINNVPSSKAEAATIDAQKKQIAELLDSFNDAAAKADFERYFGYFAENAVFIGTDATEHWDKNAFKEYAKPHFDKKKTWNFKSIDRHIFFDEAGKIAWFDELLSTQMKICRGSGVLRKQGNDWKIEQYVLSMTIPNDNSDAVTKMKTPIEDELIKKLTTK